VAVFYFFLWLGVSIPALASLECTEVGVGLWRQLYIRHEQTIAKSKLHTDFLREKFGDVSLKVLRSNNRERLVVISQKKTDMPLTVAASFFQDSVPPELAKIHLSIKKGKSMGDAFREAGYVIEKNTVEEGIKSFPETNRLFQKTGLCPYRVYHFTVRRQGSAQVWDYATITEIDSPLVGHQMNFFPQSKPDFTESHLLGRSLGLIEELIK
jgi:hypothetical protein